nr:PREDICTED: transmembrane protein 213 [Lepisosteus oculatus]
MKIIGMVATVMYIMYVFCRLICPVVASGSIDSSSTHHNKSNTFADQCLGPDSLKLCSMAELCCPQIVVDAQGWIAAAIGWSLLFFTLILLAVKRLSTMGMEAHAKTTEA